jgi:hypothetical protein
MTQKSTDAFDVRMTNKQMEREIRLLHKGENVVAQGTLSNWYGTRRGKSKS